MMRSLPTFVRDDEGALRRSCDPVCHFCCWRALNCELWHTIGSLLQVHSAVRAFPTLLAPLRSMATALAGERLHQRPVHSELGPSGFTMHAGMANVTVVDASRQ
jgi:hypothetical protein